MCPDKNASSAGAIAMNASLLTGQIMKRIVSSVLSYSKINAVQNQSQAKS